MEKRKQFKYITKIGEPSKQFKAHKISFLWNCPYEMGEDENSTTKLILDRTVTVFARSWEEAYKIFNKEFPTTCIAIHL